jgi:hypothetical protein
MVATVSLLFNQSIPFVRIELFGVELSVFVCPLRLVFCWILITLLILG